MKTAKMDMNTVVMVLAVGVFAWLIYSYSQRKNTNFMSPLGYSNYPTDSNSLPLNPSPSPYNPSNDMLDFAKTNGEKTNTYGLKTSQQLMEDPSMLLPNDTNKEWATLNPQGNGQLKNAELMSSTFLQGVDTVHGTKRNMNLQLRSEPIIQQSSNTGPWLQSTIEPDLMRRPLEIGQGPN